MQLNTLLHRFLLLVPYIVVILCLLFTGFMNWGKKQLPCNSEKTYITVFLKRNKKYDPSIFSCMNKEKIESICTRVQGRDGPCNNKCL